MLIYIFCRSFYPHNEFAPLFALLFYGLHPIAAQGSFILDLDNTVLAFTTLLFFFIYIKSYNLPDRIRTLIVPLALIAVLFSKLVPIPAVVFSMFIDYSVRSNWAKGVKEVAKISILGIAAYFIINSIAYFILGYGDYIFQQYLYIVNIFLLLLVTSQTNVFYQLALTAGRLIIWMSPFFLVLFAGAAVRKFKAIRFDRKASPDFIIGIYAVLTLILSLITAKLTYGFPKMQSSIMPIATVFVAGNLSLKRLDRRDFILCVSILLFAVLFLYFAVGDVLYVVNYSAKESLIYGNNLWFEDIILPLLLYMSFPILLIGALMAFCRKIRFKDSIILSLTISFIASNMYISVIHARVDYLTGFDYGTRGKKELISFIKGIAESQDAIFAPVDIFYALKTGGTNVQYREAWGHSERFIDYIRTIQQDIIVYGVTINTVYQFQNTLRNKKVLNFLNGFYDKKDIGSYSVWVSKRKKTDLQ
ncbi:MAG: hypothetical protein JW800_04570 [Candidatus Omnitrophica bacterium]|nr:hypothetical protein [Candidatus Omnitrophota bacterium]